MTRREALVNVARLGLLRLRVWRGAALPAALMTLLRVLDRWAAGRAVDRPYTGEASRRIDEHLVDREGRR
jgi:hypothetical protein